MGLSNTQGFEQLLQSRVLCVDGCCPHAVLQNRRNNQQSTAVGRRRTEEEEQQTQTESKIVRLVLLYLLHASIFHRLDTVCVSTFSRTELFANRTKSSIGPLVVWLVRSLKFFLEL